MIRNKYLIIFSIHNSYFSFIQKFNIRKIFLKNIAINRFKYHLIFYRIIYILCGLIK